MTTELKIEGLSCSHCVNAVTTILKELDGVTNAEVNLPDTAKVDFDENRISLEEIKTAVNESEIYKAS
ncbi:MAG TPA: cation transporter [Vicingaceae bacterium]|nr:cation transporter [Vicingaceae bacterium]